MYGNANFLDRSESELEEENDERGIISEDDGLEGDDDDEIGNLESLASNYSENQAILTYLAVRPLHSHFVSRGLIT